MIDVTQRRAADAWFLDRGLPAVLRPGALVRRLWPRSAPALAAFAVSMAFSVLVVLVTGKHTIDINGHPTRSEWFVLAMLVLVLPVAAVVGWRVSRIRSVRARTLAAFVSVGIAIAAGLVGGPSPRIDQSRVRGHRDRRCIGADRLRRRLRPWVGTAVRHGEPRIRRRAVRA